MSDPERIEALLADNPALASALEAVVDADEATETWAFDDVPVDTGQFGKLVERGVVEQSGGQYCLADPAAIRTALDRTHEKTDTEQAESGGMTGMGVAGSLSLSTPLEVFDTDRSITGIDVGAVSVLLAVAVVARAFIYSGVFRGGRVVLTVNDPYFYRYWVEQLQRLAGFPLDPTVLWRLPDTVAAGEPFYVVALWVVTSLLGAGTDVTGVVLAWYPVVAAAITVLALYALGAHVLGDRRLGFVAAFVLAISPGYATRTALGFADHHPFDYLWLAVTMVALTWLLTVDQGDNNTAGLLGNRVRRPIAVLSLALAGQILAWENSPLLLVPTVLFLAGTVLHDVAASRSPIPASAPVLAALGGGTAITALVHVTLGWLPAETVVAVVGLLSVGAGVVALGELQCRRGGTVLQLVGFEVAVALGIAGGLSILAPDFAGRLLGRLGFLVETAGIGETESLFSFSHYLGTKYFGLFLPVGLAGMCWGLWRSFTGSRVWLALSCYAWYFTALSAVQVRFMGQFALALAVFAGVGFVWALARVGLWERSDIFRETADRPNESSTIPSRCQTALALAVLLAASTVSLAFLGPTVSIAVHDDKTAETAMWLSSQADEHGSAEKDGYVFSRWSVNRLYNYFLSGDAKSYGYAQENYRRFAYSDDPERWYRTLKDRADFVVIAPIERRPGTIQSLLYVTYGSRFEQQQGVAHYRAVFATPTEQTKVFTLVPGATITGEAPKNGSVELETTVEIPHASFTYRRVARPQNGTYALTVPYPGAYEVSVDNRTRRVTVSERAVENGTAVRVNES